VRRITRLFQRLVLLVLAIGSAWAVAGGTSTDLPKVGFEKYTLPNGLQVILHVDRKLPIVHVNQWFHVGSKNEKPGRTGFAHLFEHLMFEGSKNAPGKYLSFAEKAGANLREGGVNGTTSNDRTNYFITVPSGSLETVLWLESDRLATLTEALTKENLDHQRDVVKNERRQGLENQPYGRAFKLIDENLYPAAHPYSWPVIGSHEDLTAATFEDVKEFFRIYYTPNNLSLVIAGDFDPAEAKKLVARYFGPIPAGPALDRPARFVPTLVGEKVIEVSDRVPQERVYIVWPAPAFFEVDGFDLDLASKILTDGLSSRLNRALVYDRQLCTSVNAFYWDREISGAFVTIATARAGTSLKQVEETIASEIARLARQGPTPEELDRAKTKSELEFVSGLERIGGFGGKADLLNMYNTFLGDPKLFADVITRTRAVTPASMQHAVSKWIDTPNRLAVRFHPETSARAESSDLDRTKQPPLAADRPVRAPDVRSARLGNGMEVLVVERHDLPKVAVSIVARAGSVTDPVGKGGVATLAARTMPMGTKTKKALDIEDAFGNLGTSCEGSASVEGGQVGFEVLKRNLVPALGLLGDVVQNPIYPESEVEREKKRQLDAISQQLKNPNAIARRVGAVLAFGREHPYGRPMSGSPASVPAITRADLQAFHAERWRPANAALVLVGDVTLEEALALANKALGAWTGSAAAEAAIPEPVPIGPGKVFLIDRQDAAQTVVLQVLPGPARTAGEVTALRLVDAVWGGGFATRLNLNLREGKGYSYGVFSNLEPRSRYGLWTSSGGVQTAKTKESVVEFVKELKDIGGERPIDAKELTEARNTRLRGWAQSFESYERVAGTVAANWAAGFPVARLQQEIDETASLPLSAVLDAEKKWARPDRASLLLVGDLSKIRAGVEELKLGEIVLLDVEGRPVR
jgi:zinc protease